MCNRIVKDTNPCALPCHSCCRRDRLGSATREHLGEAATMWDGERLEYVMGATAHLLAQMGDQQVSLLLT